MSLTYLPRFTLASRAAMLLLILGTLLSPIAYAQAKKKPAPVPPVNKNPGTLGRNQLKGGEGQWGQTYSTTGNFDGWNITFVSAAYSIEPHQGEFPFVVGKDEKFLLIRLRLKNTTSGDRDTERFSIPFTVVDAAGNSLDSQSACVRTSDGKPLTMSMKPGFGVDDLVQAING